MRHEARRELPVVFGSGAALSAGAAAMALTPVRHVAPARRLAQAGTLSEIATKELMEHRLNQDRSARRCLTRLRRRGPETSDSAAEWQRG